MDNFIMLDVTNIASSFIFSSILHKFNLKLVFMNHKRIFMFKDLPTIAKRLQKNF
jgi:hypothetical protein